MNTRFILPATFALTVQAFVLFGLSGKRPVVISLATEEPKSPEKTWLPLDRDEPIRVANGDEERTEVRTYKNIAPRDFDPPRWDRKENDFIVTPLPPIEGRGHPEAIPVDWAMPRSEANPLSGPVDLRYLDRVPRARLQPAPVYPSDMRKNGTEGTVVVEFLVDEAGNVYHATVLSATVPGFEEAALRAVARWKFEPGYRNGHRVRFRMSVPLVFLIAAE
jgi:protein TonB